MSYGRSEIYYVRYIYSGQEYWTFGYFNYVFLCIRKIGAKSVGTLIRRSSSFSYLYPTKWGRYNVLPSCYDDVSEIVITTGRLPDVNPP
jgi:hypothetical protein